MAGAGSVDVSFNAISVDHIQGVPLAEMTEEQIVAPSPAVGRPTC